MGSHSTVNYDFGDLTRGLVSRHRGAEQPFTPPPPDKFEIRAREVEGVTILDLDGKFFLKQGVEALRSKVSEIKQGSLAAGKPPRVILNVEKTHGDSSFLGEVVNAYIGYQKEGGSVGIIGASENKKIAEIWNVTRMYMTLSIYPDEATAVKFPSIDPEDRKPIVYRPRSAGNIASATADPK